MQTLDFADPTKNSKKNFVENLWTSVVHQTEGLHEIFQNHIGLNSVFSNSKHRKLPN